MATVMITITATIVTMFAVIGALVSYNFVKYACKKGKEEAKKMRTNSKGKLEK